MKSLEECFRLLGLPRTASAAEVTGAFRRLAKRHHPDVNPGREARRRFVDIVEAYAILREELRDRSAGSRWGRCPRCHHYADLFDAVDGAEGCVDCLVGNTYRSRFLPLPVVVMARHLSVIGLYAACVLFLGLYLRTGEWKHVATSLIAVATGMLVLAAEVLALARNTPVARPARRWRAST